METQNEVNPALGSIIQDSKKEIHDEVERKSKGRGRPKKDQSTTTAKTQGHQNQTNFNSPVMQPMSKDTYKNMLGGALDLLNLYLNKYTGTEIFTLTKEEREMITETGGTTMMDFMPAVNPMYINAIGFACVMGGVYGMKYQAYSDYVKLENEKTKNSVVEIKK